MSADRGENHCRPRWKEASAGPALHTMRAHRRQQPTVDPHARTRNTQARVIEIPIRDHLRALQEPFAGEVVLQVDNQRRRIKRFFRCVENAIR